MRPRAIRWRRLAVLGAVGALGLSACTFHPGQAAVVNGQSVSQSKVDTLVLAACAFTKVQRVEQGGPSPDSSMAYFRNIFVGQEITFLVTNDVATDQHLTVSPADIAKITAHETVPAAVTGAQRTSLIGYFEASAKAELQTALIAAHLKNPAVTQSSAVSSQSSDAIKALLAVGTKYLDSFTAKQSVSVNPAYGTWKNGTVVDTDGSLSSAVSFTAKNWLALRANDAQSVKGLPPSQVCG